MGSREKSKDCRPNDEKNGNDEFVLNIGFVTLGDADVVGVVFVVDMLGDRPCGGGGKKGAVGHGGIEPRPAKRDIGSSAEFAPGELFVLDPEPGPNGFGG